MPSTQRYEYSTLALHLWTNNLARRLSEKRSKFVVITQLASLGRRCSPALLPPVSSVLGLVMHPQTTGAYTSVFAACAPRDNPEIFQGAYIYLPSIAVPQTPVALDEDG
ncbi:hypothetical protein ARMSODRAFT_1028313 [Armillaria solidipes]|uniref:Uncharacterized protein n=1 Tax=Armillaria solidipes TaxID=1076256 RepID=A0A2H3B3E5_9AGAR|nr:hypothetical protein ARMSODRAFT_1028313 [Armillaria solidipes]